MAEARRDGRAVPGGFGLRDLAWAALAVGIGGLYLYSVWVTLRDIANGDPRLGAIVALPFGLFSAGWLALGAWRRSVWGRRTAPAIERGGADEP